MEHLPQFKDFFFQQFSDWEKSQPGKRSTFTAFADYLSHNSLNLVIRQQYVSGWIKGDFEPSEKYAPALAEKLGNEVYEILEFKPPNPLLLAINSRWEHIPPDKQQKLAELAEQFEVKNNAQQRLQDTSKRTKKASHK